MDLSVLSGCTCSSERREFTVELIFLDSIDDDVRVTLRGQVVDNRVFYWDRNQNAYISMPNTDLRRNVNWYDPNFNGPGDFQDNIKLNFTNRGARGDVINIDVFDGWETGFKTAPWEATVTYFDGSKELFVGGTLHIGTSQNHGGQPVPKEPYIAAPPTYADFYPNGSFVLSK